MSLSTGATARTASPKERSLWMLDRLVPDAGANNVPAALRIGGRLDRPALRTALTAVVRRHDALRTVFHAADDTLTASVVAPGGTDLDVQEITPSADGPQAALTAFAATPFALDGRPLIRVGLLADGDDDVLCFVVHHLVFDTVSAGVFTRSLARAYARVLRGEQPYPADEGTGPVPVLDEPAPRPQSTDFWRDHLAGFDPGALETDCGTGHNPARPTLAGGRLDHTLTPGATAAVRKLAKELRAPEAVVLLAAYYLLLAAHGAGPDLVVGTPVNVRGDGAADAIGYHVNTLPLRTVVDPGESFRALVTRTRNVFFGALSHADAPVDALLAEVARPGASWRGSLFRHVFNYVPAPGDAGLAFGDTPARPEPAESGYCKFDLELNVLATPETLSLRVVHGTEALAEADARALVRRYDALLSGLGEAADRTVAEIEVGTDADRTALRTGYEEAVRAGGTAGFVASAGGREALPGVRGELCLVATSRSAADDDGHDGAHPQHGPYRRTGELARRGYDGTLEILGRADRRVTVHGVPVQLDRLEALLASEDGVRAAAVVLRKGDDTDPGGLVAFLAAPDDPQLLDRLRKRIGAELPAAAEPGSFVVLDALPTAADGRPDLAELERRAAAGGTTGADDADDADGQLLADLVELWNDVLERDDVGPQANFFELGGHSLLAAKVAQRSGKLAGVRVRLADVFANPTPLTLAEHLRAARA
ncbi:condensation domain-containing protein [Streptomyces lydicus]|uniref:condensation domain-containing protein n=1 Tax=Streptomyces lydicus TaxID=47763 RepID=UPI0037A5C01E